MTRHDMGGKLRVLDLFSGIGGFSLGLERTGEFETVAFCEIDPFCRRVLAKHWPTIPCHDDITTREFHEGEADVITGGFPCQDVSLAGRRAGLAGANSGLYRELVRALRVVRPRYGIVENVAALLSDGMGTVLGDLAESGIDTEWDCVPACAIGAPHERDRVWIVTHANHERCGEAWQLQHRPLQVPAGGTEARAAARDASDPSCEQTDSHAPRDGCGQGRTQRPPDSFAGVRDEACRNVADPCSARLAFRAGLTRDAWEEFAPTERDAISNGGKSLWPDEPALSGVDDGIPDWMDRVRSTGNAILPQIPEIIGCAVARAIRSEAA